MVLNYIWIAFFLVAFVFALVRLVFWGDFDVFPAMMDATFSSSKTAFEISLGLTGVLSLWLGIMKIGERGGLVNVLARLLSPVFVKLFPDIPKGHPVTGSIFMNIAANMLGLDNAATPLGLKAMEQLEQIKRDDIQRQTGLNDAQRQRLTESASNPMIMFLVLNTSGLTLIPISIMVYRAQAGAAQPTDIFIPILLATFVSTLAGVLITSAYQRISLLNRTMILTLVGASLLVALTIWGFAQLDSVMMNRVSTSVANILLMTIIVGFILAGMLKGVGAAVEACGLDSDFVAALPTALMKPLSGSGARGMMVDAMATYGADSFVGRLSCIFQGSTDTTFYILAVYFGSVGVRHTRHAVTCGLLADLAGMIAAIAIGYMFFG